MPDRDAATVYPPGSPEQERFDRRGWLTCDRCRRMGHPWELRTDHPNDPRPCDRGVGCSLVALDRVRHA